MKNFIITITCIITGVFIGVASSYLMVVKGIKWPAGIVGLAIAIGCSSFRATRLPLHQAQVPPIDRANGLGAVIP